MGTTPGYVIGHRHTFSRIDISKELEHIASIAPLDDLPPSLRRTSTNRRPPEVYFGWLIDDDATAVLMAKAHETQCCVYTYDEDRDEGDDYDEDDDDDDEEEPKGRRVIHEFGSMDCAAIHILRGMEIALPVPQNLTLALTTTGRNYYGYCFTLFTNYTLDKSLPSAEEIKRIQEELKFKCDPQWWPAWEFEWGR